MPSPIRKTTQLLIPPRTPEAPPKGRYNLWPVNPLPEGRIEKGYGKLIERIARRKLVCIDGFTGVDWDEVVESLQAEAALRGTSYRWLRTEDFLLPEDEIDALVAPFLGGDDPIFGFRCDLPIERFFRLEELRRAVADLKRPCVVVGPGAGLLAEEDDFLVYIDMPKNEAQFRSRAGSVRSLGHRNPRPDAQYKRFYFVDWPVLNREKCRLLPSIDLIVDAQRPGDPRFLDGGAFRRALKNLTKSPFRARPWFEPGPWGGQWIRENVDGLSPDVPNYAWSFELISPENGLFFGKNGDMIEVTFDFLMYCDHRAILGECADAFMYEFPIRFDFLDTFDGGNLSLQCHPRPAYVREKFGETFTQDETYYILDCKPGAEVYLGFREGIDRQEFRAALEESFREGTEVDVDRFVLRHPAEKHDLFLIPNGTIHCSGIDNLVLEISATPYIFTFKMYDWLRLDLNGKPRPLNIERAFENLYFDRAGEDVSRELISTPRVIREFEGGRVVHLPTHPHHFYDIRRYEFSGEVEVETNDSAHVLSLVEGATVIVETEGAAPLQYNYAETFVVPAAAVRFRMRSSDGEQIKVVDAFMKPREACLPGSWPAEERP